MSLIGHVSNASHVKAAPRFRRRLGSFFRYRSGILLVLLICALVFGAGSVNSSSGAIPTFSIQSVATDQTVTIAKLMEIAPQGTTDPTSSLYNVTMYLMAALLAVALVSNLLMRPVHPRHHISDDEPADDIV